MFERVRPHGDGDTAQRTCRGGGERGGSFGDLVGVVTLKMSLPPSRRERAGPVCFGFGLVD